MNYETSRSIAAPPEHVWDRLTDIEGWPDWIDIYEFVQRLDDGKFRVGSRARIKRRGLHAAVWTVTHEEIGHSFVWESDLLRVRTTARHVVSAEPTVGRTRLIVGIHQRGALSGLVGWVAGGRIRNFIDSEATGIKDASEARRRSG